MMRSIKHLVGILPAIALAACLDQAPESGPTGPSEVAAAASARGAIIAQSMCASCHGTAYQGGVVEDVECPSLAVVRNYSLAEFDALLAIGVERDGGTANGFMAITHTLSPTDIADVHQYLKNYHDQ